MSERGLGRSAARSDAAECERGSLQRLQRRRCSRKSRAGPSHLVTCNSRIAPYVFEALPHHLLLDPQRRRVRAEAHESRYARADERTLQPPDDKGPTSLSVQELLLWRSLRQ